MDDTLIFQSTLSVRRATSTLVLTRRMRDISIHALRKESDNPLLRHQQLRRISIHALRKESDTGTASASRSSTHFNPRSP